MKQAAGAPPEEPEAKARRDAGRAPAEADAESALQRLESLQIGDWADIDQALDTLPRQPVASDTSRLLDPAADLRVAFATFDFGIDGVSMEIAKYATCLEKLKRSHGAECQIHCIAGDFYPAADHVLRSHWRRRRIAGCNGWAKWGDGRLFDRLFAEPMKEGSSASGEVARAVWSEALSIARMLSDYLAKRDVELLVTINVHSNPGNLSYALALVLAAETLGIHVLDSCHDFYWEAGKPAAERAPDEPPGPRDHFFTNHENRPFYRVFRRLLPWNGQRWHHFTINGVQRDVLARDLGLGPDRVSVLGTFVEPSYFIPCTKPHKKELRQRLATILGGGERVISTISVHRFRDSIPQWMEKQEPIVCTSSGGDSVLNIIYPTALLLLQPTRVIARKRIVRDLELIEALLDYRPFRALFEEVPELTLTLHITGPVPVEHRGDFEAVIVAYMALTRSLPKLIARRIFLALSAGKLGHSALGGRGVSNLEISDLYKLSDLVLLPSETEGRGLPIVEAAAAGVPIVCSRYQPEEVFSEVVGEDLDPGRRIAITTFPEGRFTGAFLQEVTDSLFLQQGLAGRMLHNRRVVAERFGMEALQECFIHGMKGAAGDPP